jgi:multidrug efflux pump
VDGPGAHGQAKGYFTLTNISANTDLTSVEQFRKMVVKAKGDSLIRVEDIGTVELGAQSSNSSVSMNSEHAVFIGINATPDANPLDLVQGIRALLPELQRNLPPALTMSIPYDSTDFIRASINEVIRSLALSVGIVVVVIFLFLGTFRSVLIPIVTIPLSLIGAMTIMLALGFSINLLTLLAMVLAIGLVVDDAIVVVENVHRWIEHGKTPVQAAMIGAREIVGPIIAMTITLAAVYAPIGLLGGLTGTLFREFAFTLAGSVIISGIIALTLSPMMCSMLLKTEATQGGFARLIDRVLSSVTRFYGRRLHSTLNYRPLIAIFCVVIFGIVGFEYVNSRTELAPPEDQGILFGVTKGPQYANLDYMDAYGDKVDQVFKSFPESVSRFILNGTGFASSSVSQGFAGMLLKPWEERSKTAMSIIPAVQNKLTEQVDGMRVFMFNRPPLPGSSPGLPIQMVISSPVGYETIYRLMDEIKKKAQASHMFLVTDSDLDFNQPVIKLKVDRSKANDLGITMQSIGDTLAVLVGENYINLFSLDGRSYQVIPQVPRVNRLTSGTLLDYYVTTPTGQSVPLATVVTAETGTDANALTQYNQLNSATLGVVPAPGITMGTAVDYLDRLAAETLPKGFQHDFLGESRQYVQEGNQLTFTLIFALIIIYLVLAAQFESLRDPLIILISVPMAISGALLPLFIGVVTLNIYTKVGLVTLIGLIAKHGILMVEFANEMQIRDNFDRRTAIEHAAAVRLRPILMTTAAMVVGLIPLLIATGAGAASRLSMGIVIVFGMTIGTLFTLFVLPAVYTVLAKDHRAAASSKRASDIAAVMAGE